MRKPDSRTVLALLFALAAGIATAALQPGRTPQTNGLIAAKAVAVRLAGAVESSAAIAKLELAGARPMHEHAGVDVRRAAAFLPTVR